MFQIPSVRNKLPEAQAKCCHIEYRDYTEEEAHKYIEKRAMDERRTKRDIAEDVIETYKID